MFFFNRAHRHWRREAAGERERRGVRKRMRERRLQLYREIVCFVVNGFFTPWLTVMMSKYELGMGELNPTFASGPISLEVACIKAFKHERAMVKQVLQSAANSEEPGGVGESAGESPA